MNMFKGHYSVTAVKMKKIRIYLFNVKILIFIKTPVFERNDLIFVHFIY